MDFTADYTNIDIAVNAGYFFADKLVGGITTFLSSAKREVAGGSRTNALQFTIGPFIRYYFLEKEKPFNLLADISYQPGVMQSLYSAKDKPKYNIYSIMGGTEVFFNSSIGLELLVGYRSQQASLKDSPSALLSLSKKGFQASIGFQFHLEKNYEKNSFNYPIWFRCFSCKSSANNNPVIR
jgi:hypothetical protein